MRMICALAVVLVASAALAAEPKSKNAGGSRAASANELTLYEYDDGTGPRQVETLAEVPKKYRAKAERITMSRSYGTTRSPAPERRPKSATSDPSGPWPSRSSAPDSSPGKPAAAPAERKVVYCQYFYLAGLARMKQSFCTSGEVSEATASCEQVALGRFKEAIPCWCTDDKSYISTRCG